MVVNDDGGSHATINGSTTVVDATLTAVLGGQSITSTEGAGTGSVLLATFTDPAGGEAVGDYSATLDWGDGSATDTVGSIVHTTGNNFQVYGTHTYAEESSVEHVNSTPYTITIQLHHESAADPAPVTSTATVSDAQLTSAAGVNVSATEGAIFTGIVATFVDPAGSENIADYTATISWGGAGAGSAHRYHRGRWQR